jgi:hypothetical protein
LTLGRQFTEYYDNYVLYYTYAALRLTQFQDARKTMPSAYHKQILVGLNEDSVRARKTRLKSASPMSTTTRLQVITNNTLEKMIPDKKYDDFHGSTRNDMLSLVVLPPLELMWNVPLKQKIALYHHNDGSRRITLAEVRFFVRPV